MQIDVIDPKKTAMIVVDMQNDFCHRDGIAGKRGRDMAFVQDMIPRLVNLARIPQSKLREIYEQ